MSVNRGPVTNTVPPPAPIRRGQTGRDDHDRVRPPVLDAVGHLLDHRDGRVRGHAVVHVVVDPVRLESGPDPLDQAGLDDTAVRDHERALPPFRVGDLSDPLARARTELHPDREGERVVLHVIALPWDHPTATVGRCRLLSTVSLASLRELA